MTNPWIEKLVGHGQRPLPLARRRQLRQLNWSLVTLVVALLVWSSIQVAHRAWTLMAWHLSLAACGVVLWLLVRLTRRITLLAHLTCLVLVLTLAVSAYYSGGFTGPNLALFLVVPVGAVTVAGVAGLWWAVLAALIVVSLALATEAGYSFPYLVPESARDLDGMMSWLTAVAVVSFLIWRYDVARERAERESLDALSQAELASQVRSRFISGVGQELHLPALSLVNLVRQLCEDPNSASRLDWLEEARAGSRLLTALVDNVLELARSEKEHTSQQMVFAPRELCQQVLKAFAAIPLGEGERKTTLAVAQRVPEKLVGDETSLKRLLLNLLFDLAERSPSNAGLALRVDLVEQDDKRAGLQIRLVVENDGGDRPPAHGERRRPDISQPEIAASVARQLADWMGANLERFSDRHSWGYDVIVRLKIATVEKSLPESDTGVEAAPMTADTCRILIAEDNPISRHMLRRLLEREGCQVVEAQDGLAAVKLAASTDVHLLLLDIEMPGLDGCRAARRIRALESPRRAAVPIIAVTAHDNEEQRRRCLEAGMSDFMPKPFGVEELQRVLAKWLPALGDSRGGQLSPGPPPHGDGNSSPDDR